MKFLERNHSKIVNNSTFLAVFTATHTKTPQNKNLTSNIFSLLFLGDLNKAVEELVTVITEQELEQHSNGLDDILDK